MALSGVDALCKCRRYAVRISQKDLINRQSAEQAIELQLDIASLRVAHLD
jgi:hypothetical protein